MTSTAIRAALVDLHARWRDGGLDAHAALARVAGASSRARRRVEELADLLRSLV